MADSRLGNSEQKKLDRTSLKCLLNEELRVEGGKAFNLVHSFHLHHASIDATCQRSQLLLLVPGCCEWFSAVLVKSVHCNQLSESDLPVFWNGPSLALLQRQTSNIEPFTLEVKRKNIDIGVSVIPLGNLLNLRHNLKHLRRKKNPGTMRVIRYLRLSIFSTQLLLGSQAWTTSPPLSPRAKSMPYKLLRMNTMDDGLSDEHTPKNITELAEKKVRLAKVQAEIDSILNDPIDPPFDIETEMKKVVSITPPLVAEGSSEYAYEEQVNQMEAALYQAVKQQDYKGASQQESEISQLHVDDCGLVLQANSRFYDAFSKKDHSAMEAIWLQDRSCICIHPSHKPLVGARDIMKSWDRMFQSSNGSFQRNWMEPQEVRMTVKANTAIVTCEEHVYTRRFIRGQKRRTELVNKLQATNVFRKVGDKWYLTYHHSSWHADSDAAKAALKQGGGSKGSKVPGGQGDDNEAGSSEMNNILGSSNVGPLLGDSKPGSESSSGPKRVIMGSLSDLLSGNLGDFLGGEGDDSSNNGNGIGGESFGGGNNGIGPSKAIIQFRNIDNVGDDDEENDDEEDGDGDGDSDDASVKKLKQWANADDNPKSSSASKNPLRQGCIGLLRKLATEGRISAKQKRVLLTDIISCSAKGEYSMVEVAFELLCSEGAADDDAEEEFADQCRVFAEQTYE
eukprot:scaffold1525_cov142-Cylindrotheca_fusiformis.AAC.120